jgi:ABC-2 type transport system ATP-binding protein
MIEVTGLTRYYGDHPAVRDVSFSIADNEIVGFLGLNGAGKSTTLKVLAGLLLPSAGTVKIAGLDALEAPDSLRERIGFLPEEPPLYREMKVSEFLAFCGQVKGMSADAVRARLPEVYRVCDIAHVSDRVIDELSHGYRKRVGIAQAIIHDPDLVILDEPISGLDPVQIVEMRRVITGLKASCTVLVSSHILSEISQTCDRILVLNSGRLVAEGTEEELSARLAGGGRVAMELRGAAAAVQAALEGFEGLEGVTVEDAGGGLVRAGAHMSDDRREALVKHLVQADIGVREIRDAEAELEQIFLDLTRKQEGAA